MPSSLLDRVPEPAKDWTDAHDPEGIEGAVTQRDDFVTKTGDEFTVIVVTDETGNEYRVPLSRVDLKPLVERERVAEGDRIAIRFWGLAGPKFVYTFVVEKAGSSQGHLKVADPAGEATEYSDADVPAHDAE